MADLPSESSSPENQSPSLEESLELAEWRFERAYVLAHDIIEMQVDTVAGIYRDVARHWSPSSGRPDQYDFEASAKRQRADTIIVTTADILDLIGKLPGTAEGTQRTWRDVLKDEVVKTLREDESRLEE